MSNRRIGRLTVVPRVVICGLAVAMASALGVTSSIADTPSHDSTESDSAAGSCFSSEEASDLSVFAKQKDLPLETAMARFCGASEFNILVDQLRTDLADLFVYAEWGFGEGKVIGRPGAAEKFQRAASAAGARVVVSEANLPSETEQQGLIGAVAEQVGTYAPQASAMIGYDVSSNSVTVVIDDDSSLSRLRSGAAKAIDSAGAAKWGVAVRIDADTGFGFVPQIQGGGNYGSGGLAQEDS